MAGKEDADFAARLGAEIRNRRMARGMSLRGLAKELNLSGHATLVDDELGYAKDYSLYGELRARSTSIGEWERFHV